MPSPSTGAYLKKKAVSLLWFLFHQLLSTIGMLAFSAVLVFAVSRPARAHEILTGTPYFPIQILLAFLVGFVLRRYLQHQAMPWVWVLPLSILFVCFFLTPLPFDERVEHYFGWACRPEFHCFVQLAVTLPFYSSVSYSLASFLSKKAQASKQDEISK